MYTANFKIHGITIKSDFDIIYYNFFDKMVNEAKLTIQLLNTPS